MLVGELMTADPRTCVAGDRLDRAAAAMWEADVGALPVIDDRGAPVGMITDRDICMATLLRGAGPGELSVGSAMSRSVVTCRIDDPPGVVRQLMADHQLRRVPVVDGAGRLRGVVTLADLALAADRARAMAGAAELRPADVAHLLAAICAPRHGRRS
jgi:CBS domain-containing protein